MRAADLIATPHKVETTDERGGLVGKVQAIVFEQPGLTTREIAAMVRDEGWRVSGALNKLKNEGVITAIDFKAHRLQWVQASTQAPAEPERRYCRADAFCRCGVDIVFGSLATDDDRARPRCSTFPFARRGASC